jgi:hypothetical protein
MLDSSSCMPDRSELTQPWSAFWVLVFIELAAEVCVVSGERVNQRDDVMEKWGLCLRPPSRILRYSTSRTTLFLEHQPRLLDNDLPMNKIPSTSGVLSRYTAGSECEDASIVWFFIAL